MRQVGKSDRVDGGPPWSVRGRAPVWAVCLLLTVAAGVASTGCERQKREEPTHPAAETARVFLEAVKYRDVERAWRHHVESTQKGVYCNSTAFKKVLERTRKEKTAVDCREARQVSQPRRAALSDDAELLLQILRFVCKEPDGDCVDYAKYVFRSQFPERAVWKQMGRYDIRRVNADGRRATVYVDVQRGRDGEDNLHTSLKLVENDGEWYVEQVSDGDREAD